MATARDTVFTPLDVEGAVERIVRRLGEAIGSGVLEPGERLPSEVELAERLHVAPMTLRQALAILREAGYIETRRGRGAGSFVVEDLAQPLGTGRVPTHAEVRELVDWRRAVGAEAAFLAAARGDADARARLVEAATKAEEAATGPFPEYRRADSAFHIAVAETAGSTRLVTAETAIQAELGEILAPLPGSSSTDAVSASTTGHEPIVAAIVAGEAAAAREAMLAHIEATFDWIVGLHLGRLTRTLDG